ncbi:MAG: HU family DNA-binding protein [Hyphomicrobium sp.]|nr:HU family DNA-binding protein [Hyphomicrobium sp.]
MGFRGVFPCLPLQSVATQVRWRHRRTAASRRRPLVAQAFLELTSVAGTSDFRVILGLHHLLSRVHRPASDQTEGSKKMAKAPVAKAATVTLRQLGATLSEKHELSKKQTLLLLEDLVAHITKHLKKGERIRIGGLGVLQVRKRPARMGRNPATGEQIKIKASKKVAFRAAKELKEAV